MVVRGSLKRVLPFICVLLAAGFFGVVSIAEARAATLTVSTNADTSDASPGNGLCADSSGNCTLRAAIEEANALAGNDTINFAANLTGATITLTTGQILISGTNGNLQISGPGADKLTVDGGAGSNRIFLTDNNAIVTIGGLTMQGGNGESGGQGGAIFANGGTLSLVAVFIRNNSVGDRGGAVFFNGGTNHRILNSAISANSAAAVGGGIYLSGGTLFAANTTISTNNSGQAGGAYIGGTATFRNLTITLNTAPTAGGLEVFGGTLNLGNSILAGNSASNFPEVLNFGGTTSVGNNFVGDSPGDSTSTNTAITYQASDVRDQNPMLGILQNNGGPTPTHALLAGSPAINAGDNTKAVDPSNNSTLVSDQRVFFARIGGGAVDIGAYEFNSAPTAAGVTVTGRVLNFAGRGVTGAIVTLADPRGGTRSFITTRRGQFQFSDVPTGETVVITVTSRRYTFEPRILTLTDDLNEVNFSPVDTRTMDILTPPISDAAIEVVRRPR